MNDGFDELSTITDPSDPIFAPLPAPGAGQTPTRFRALWQMAARSPSLGRVAEAHHDAAAILHEAGRSHIEPGLHAVWAAGGNDLQLDPVEGRWRLHGSKRWCSASTFADWALVTARVDADDGALVIVDLSDEGIRPEPSDWESPGMRGVDTRTVHFDLLVSPDAVIGAKDWYLRRPGFWHGAVGVAACWAGCVDGVVSRLAPTWRSDPHACAHLGAIDAQLWNLRTMLDVAGDEIDAEPIGDPISRQRRALRVRHIADAAIADIVDRIARALGPGPLAQTPRLHRHIAEINLYRRQSHAERDLEVLGRLAGPPIT